MKARIIRPSPRVRDRAPPWPDLRPRPRDQRRLVRDFIERLVARVRQALDEVIVPVDRSRYVPSRPMGGLRVADTDRPNPQG